MSMTNEELAQAIEIADKRVRECGTGQPRYEPLLQHLQALLAEQRRRAEQPLAPPVMSPTGPLWVQPVIVQPTWVPRQPWEPPWTITCAAGTQ